MFVRKHLSFHSSIFLYLIMGFRSKNTHHTIFQPSSFTLQHLPFNTVEEVMVWHWRTLLVFVLFSCELASRLTKACKKVQFWGKSILDDFHQKQNRLRYTSFKSNRYKLNNSSPAFKKRTLVNREKFIFINRHCYISMWFHPKTCLELRRTRDPEYK